METMWTLKKGKKAISTYEIICYKNPLWDIVTEEAEMYFAGDSTLDAAVQKIQARVQLYLDEL